MNYLHKVFQLNKGDTLEVHLDNSANVQLLDPTNYALYSGGQPYRYHGGHVTTTPFVFEVPDDGEWHLTVDLGGGAGRVAASVRIVPATEFATQL